MRATPRCVGPDWDVRADTGSPWRRTTRKYRTTMTSTIDRITISGTALAAPVITPDRIAEFPVREDRSQREYLVRIPADDLRTFVTRDARVAVDGEAAWTVPGRSWRGEASRTILLAGSVHQGELALAA